MQDRRFEAGDHCPPCDDQDLGYPEGDEILTISDCQEAAYALCPASMAGTGSWPANRPYESARPGWDDLLDLVLERVHRPLAVEESQR